MNFIKYFINTFLLRKKYKIGDLVYYESYNDGHLRIKRAKIKEVYLTEEYANLYFLENDTVLLYRDIFKNPIKLLKAIKKEEMETIYESFDTDHIDYYYKTIQSSLNIINDVNRRIRFLNKK